MAYQVKRIGLPQVCFFGGAQGGGVPPAPDTSAVRAQQEKEANEAATKERVRRAQMTGAKSLIDDKTGYLGVPATPLGTA